MGWGGQFAGLRCVLVHAGYYEHTQGGSGREPRHAPYKVDEEESLGMHYKARIMLHQLHHTGLACRITCTIQGSHHAASCSSWHSAAEAHKQVQVGSRGRVWRATYVDEPCHEQHSKGQLVLLKKRAAGVHIDMLSQEDGQALQPRRAWKEVGGRGTAEQGRVGKWRRVNGGVGGAVQGRVGRGRGVKGDSVANRQAATAAAKGVRRELTP